MSMLYKKDLAPIINKLDKFKRIACQNQKADCDECELGGEEPRCLINAARGYLSILRNKLPSKAPKDVKHYGKFKAATGVI